MGHRDSEEAEEIVRLYNEELWGDEIADMTGYGIKELLPCHIEYRV